MISPGLVSSGLLNSSLIFVRVAADALMIWTVILELKPSKSNSRRKEKSVVDNLTVSLGALLFSNK